MEYPRWGPQIVERLRVADSELIDKFRSNGSRILPSGNVERAIQLIFSLEELDDITELVKTLQV